MALKIFNPDPDEQAKRQKRQAQGSYEAPVVLLRNGGRKGRQPYSLAEWRMMCDDPTVADALTELFGGSVTDESAPGKFPIQVDTARDEIEIIIDKKGIKSSLIQWGANGLPIHECDGQFSLLDDDRGEPCGCPPTLDEIQEQHKKQKGPGPNNVFTFRFAGAEDLGVIQYRAGAWGLAKRLWEFEADLAEIDGPAVALLSIEHFEIEVNGKTKTVHSPRITVRGPVPKD